MSQPYEHVFRAGMKVQLTDRRGKKYTVQLRSGAVTQTEHGLIRHDDIIGSTEGSVVTSVSMSTQLNERDSEYKPFKRMKAVGGWPYVIMRPRLADFVLSMPRGAQIMYPKDIAQVIELGDIRPGMRVLESGAGSGAMSLHLLEAVGSSGQVTTIEMRPEFAKVALANATVYYGRRPEHWQVLEGDCDRVCAQLEPASFDRAVLDMLDPWNRLPALERVLTPGAVLTCYVTTTTQLAKLAGQLDERGVWTAPEILETMERRWKADGLAVRPDHDMIGHTGFLVTARLMAPGVQALKKAGRVTKDTQTDIDSLSQQERDERLEELTLRDISDRKLRKVLRDLDEQVQVVEQTLDQGLTSPADQDAEPATGGA